MNLFVYNLVLTLALLVAGPVALLVVGLHPRWRVGLDQRLGRLPATILRHARQARPVWLHAASVGELLAARPFLHALKARFPNRALLVSVQTATAREAAARQCSDVDGVFLLPLDHPLLSGKIVRLLRPAVFFFTETELWPNVLASLARRGVPTLLVSGRFSPRAHRRAALLAPLFRSAVRSVSACCMQTPADAERLIAAGAKRGRVHVTGNFKIDGARASDTAGAALLDACGLGGRPLLIGASTHAPEEEILLEAARRLRSHTPTTLLLLAPRHPQRFAAVEASIEAAGCRYVKRSALPATASADTQVFLLDTLGELASFHAAAALVFVGGSLLRGPGGHSVVEPALAGVPVCFGPHTHNFASVVETLTQAGGGIEVRDAESLCRAAVPLLTDARVRRETGARARAAMDRERGAVERTLDVALRYCPAE